MGGAFAGLELSGLPDFTPAAGADAHGLKDACAKNAKNAKDACAKNASEEAAQSARPGRVVLSRLTAHRGGKTVLAIEGFGAQHTDAAIEALAKRLRNRCGCGGTVRGRVVELQGDQPSRVREVLQDEGFQVAGIR
jgi:translation initiation factor 1